MSGRNSPFASAWYNPAALGAIARGTRVHSPPQLEGKKLLVLWGGEDISPKIYQQKAVKAHAPNVLSLRDMAEVNLIHAAVHMGIPILGICRGAQLLCAVGGGSLYQHVDNHAFGGSHDLIVDGETLQTNSVHHQMMIPSADMQVIGYTPYRSPNKWLDQEEPITNTQDEPEIVYMPEMKALAVQGHPEWLGPKHPFVKIVNGLTGELLHVDIT